MYEAIRHLEEVADDLRTENYKFKDEIKRLRGLLSRSLELLYPTTENLEESLAIINIPIDELAGFCREAQATLEEPK